MKVDLSVASHYYRSYGDGRQQVKRGRVRTRERCGRHRWGGGAPKVQPQFDDDRNFCKGGPVTLPQPTLPYHSCHPFTYYNFRFLPTSNTLCRPSLTCRRDSDFPWPNDSLLLDRNANTCPLIGLREFIEINSGSGISTARDHVTLIMKAHKPRH